MDLAQTFLDKVGNLQEAAARANTETLTALAKAAADSIANDGILHVFGSGHSEIVAREVERRAGGLVPISSIGDPTEGWSEQIAGYGTRLFQRYAYTYEASPDDVCLVISNSGKNAGPLEIAWAAREYGMTVGAVTSLAMSRAVESQHPSGKRLFEIAHHVLDNQGVTGDAIVDIPGFELRVGPVSTMTGALLLNLLHLKIIQFLIEDGHTPPVYQSQNTPGGAERNEKLARKYRHRIRRPI